jgi:hypothetical protein
MEMLLQEGDPHTLKQIGAEAAQKLGANAVIDAVLAIETEFSRANTLEGITDELFEQEAWGEALAFSLAQLAFEAETGRIRYSKALASSMPAFWAIDEGKTLVKIAAVIGELEDWWN